MDGAEMVTSNIREIGPKIGASEKITINLGFVDG